MKDASHYYIHLQCKTEFFEAIKALIAPSIRLQYLKFTQNNII